MVSAVAFGAVAVPNAAHGANLTAGAGRADLTPPTGYYFMGWVRADAFATGQHTRLYARTLVLERGGRKLALVATDLGAVPNGLVADVAERVAGLGIDERDVVVTASHTHSAPAGYFNYTAFNTIAPTDDHPTDFELGTPADRQLYTFLARQLARSIARADRDRGPARAGWGQVDLFGLTENRSVEAHLNDHGIAREYGMGSFELDPLGYPHTVSAQMHVLRVEKRSRRARGGRWLPIGMWSSFANHGTVVKPDFLYYSGDHLGAASRLVERKIRRAGRVPKRQEVVNAFSNADEGDMSSGLNNTGPVGAHMVGSVEARAMMRAWRRARTVLSRRPVLDGRWTRACFCGRDTAAGAVADSAVVGLPFITGSEENRGPLYDETGVPFEGYRLPAPSGPHGYKIHAIPDPGGAFPTAVPLTVLRIGDRAIATVPGEMTSEMGRRVRAALLATGRPAGIKGVAIAGLANDFMQYFTSPEEYDRQHYEGGSTLYGRTASVFIQERLVELMSAIASGDAAPAPDEFDARNGINDDADPFGPGAGSASPLRQPDRIGRLAQARFRWQGGPKGLDRPVDRAFVRIQRRVSPRRSAPRWRTIDGDLGLNVRWSVDDEGRHYALWQSSDRTPPGVHRFLVTANRYRLASRPFRVFRRNDLELRVVSFAPSRVVVRLLYPKPVDPLYEPIVPRPRLAPGRRLIARVGGQRRVVRARRGTFVIRRSAGETVGLGRKAARDRFGNVNGRGLRVGP